MAQWTLIINSCLANCICTNYYCPISTHNSQQFLVFVSTTYYVKTKDWMPPKVVPQTEYTIQSQYCLNHLCTYIHHTVLSLNRLDSNLFPGSISNYYNSLPNKYLPGKPWLMIDDWSHKLVAHHTVGKSLAWGLSVTVACPFTDRNSFSLSSVICFERLFEFWILSA